MIQFETWYIRKKVNDWSSFFNLRLLCQFLEGSLMTYAVYAGKDLKVSGIFMS